MLISNVFENRVLFFSHRKEINEQVKKTFELNDVNLNLVTVDGVQTLVRKLDKLEEPEIIKVKISDSIAQCSSDNG